MAVSGYRVVMARLALASALSRARRNLLLARRRIPMAGRLTASRIMLAPQDMRTADPTAAEELISGYFAFSGQMVAAGANSPFTVYAPSAAWSEALHGFSWLRHLRVSDLPQAPLRARALVMAFIDGRHDREPVSCGPTILARRLQACLANAPVLLSGADRDFYEALLVQMSRDAEKLAVAARVERGLVRLTALIGLTQAALCLEGFERQEPRWRLALEKELDRQILADGGHVSRNPRALIDLLADLLPLRSTYATRGLDVPRALVSAIDRMMPMLRMLRHASGDVVLMNGMGYTPHDLLSTLIAYDDARARALDHAPYSGYLRLAAGSALVIADVGPPPEAQDSAHATTGILAFELSSGQHRIVVNCGAPRDGSARLQRIARSSAAHSTLTIEDTSPAIIRGIGGQALIVNAASFVDLDRQETDEIVSACARHDGYVAGFGVEHARRWQVSRDGDVIAGEDRLTPVAAAVTAGVSIRFHLHPSVRASSFQDGAAVLLALPDGEAWTFDANGLVVSIEESLLFAAIDGTRRTEQLVIHLPLVEDGLVALWRFARVGSQARRRQAMETPAGGPASSTDQPNV